MSDMARDFLNEWLGTHIKPLVPLERVAASVRLAVQCRRDATSAGIPLQSIRDAAEGDLIRKILQALDVAAALHEQARPAPETPVLADS